MRHGWDESQEGSLMTPRMKQGERWDEPLHCGWDGNSEGVIEKVPREIGGSWGGQYPWTSRRMGSGEDAGLGLPTSAQRRPGPLTPMHTGTHPNDVHAPHPRARGSTINDPAVGTQCSQAATPGHVRARPAATCKACSLSSMFTSAQYHHDQSKAAAAMACISINHELVFLDL